MTSVIEGKIQRLCKIHLNCEGDRTEDMDASKSF